MNTVDKFIKFEEDNNLIVNKVRNIEYWPIVREMIFSEINSKFENINIAHDNFNSKKLRNKIKGIVIFTKNILSHKIEPLENKDILIFNHPRRLKNGLHYDCPYTDSILKVIKQSYYVFEESYFQEHLKPIKTDDIRYTDRINLKFYIEYFFVKFSGLHKLEKADRNHIIYVIDKLNNEFKLELDKELYVEKIEKELIKFELLHKYYSKIIKEIKPKLIIEVISYERRRKVINSIAKKYEIPTIELQHGTIGKYEIAYNYFRKQDIHTFPDYLFTFGEYWKANSRFPIEENNVMSVGWNYFEEKVKEYKVCSFEGNNKNILFISQGTIGDKLSKIAVELESLLIKGDYQIIYKLHPGEYNRWKIEYPWLVKSNIEVVDNNDKDMHYYYAKATIQIGVYSTAIFEGLGYGLKTIICKLYGYEFMEDLYKNNYAKLVENADEIMEYLSTDILETKGVNINYFWKDNSIINVIRGIDKIIKLRDEE